MTLPARLSIVTLGVADLDRAIAFYEALGWQRKSASIEGSIAWFGTADSTIGLFPWDELAHDANLPPERTGAVRRDHARHQRREPRGRHGRARRGRRRRRHAPQAGDAGGLGRHLGLLRGPGRPPVGGRPQSRLPDRRRMAASGSPDGRARSAHGENVSGAVRSDSTQPIAAPPAAKTSASHEPVLPSRTVSRIGVGRPTRSAHSHGRSRPIAAAAPAPSNRSPAVMPVESHPGLESIRAIPMPAATATTNAVA